MVHVMARITFQPGAAAAGRNTLSDLATVTRSESGCLSYELFQQTDAPHVFQTVEQWADKAAADAHMATAHVRRAGAAAMSLLAAAPQIVVFEKVG